MSRRDTIIIAVLVNAGLLMVLFATAFRSKREDEKPKSVQIAENSQAMTDLQSPLAPSMPMMSSDEIDQVLDQLTSAPTLGDMQEEIVAATPIDTQVLGLQTSEPLSPLAPQQAPLPVAPAQPIAIAPAPKPVESKKEESIVNVTVKKGDALEKIARANNSSVAAIMKANNMSSTNLKIGQVLRVPSKGSSTSSSIAKKDEPANTSAEYYVVKEGDSPWLIASKNHVKLEELLRLNNLDEQKARRLRAGDRLRI